MLGVSYYLVHVRHEKMHFVLRRGFTGRIDCQLWQAGHYAPNIGRWSGA